MKIAHCIHGVGLGGAQQVVRHIVGARSEGFEYVVLASMSGVFHGQIEDAGAEVQVLPRRLPKFDPFWMWSLRRAMRREQVYLVHAHLFGDSLHGYLAARRLGLPVVLTLHNIVEARSGIQRRGYGWLLDQPLEPVACAAFVRRSFQDHYGERADRITTIQNAVDIPSDAVDPARSRGVLEDELGVRPGATVLAGVGRMVNQKAFEHLIDAVARLRGEDLDVQLILFGEGELKATHRARAERLGLGDAVIFGGFRSDIRELMAAIDVVVFSSRQEGLPMVLLEAMAAGRAVVATRVGGIPEAVDDDVEALLVPSEDVDALAQALERAVSDPALRARLGEAGRRRYRESFTVGRMARAYEALYRRLAEGSAT
ncbi:MAG: glycosyltransferase family 4 protein [Acidobacteriota bacterium]